MRWFLLLAAISLAACGNGPQQPLVASDVVVTRPMPGGTMSAGYLSLTNNSSETIRISGVASEQYESVQLHETTIENGIARMRSIPVLEIAAGQTVDLQRGGKHLMLMRPTGPLKTVSLRFLDGGDLILTVDAIIEARHE